jgi:hypothetical protein
MNLRPPSDDLGRNEWRPSHYQKPISSRYCPEVPADLSLFGDDEHPEPQSDRAPAPIAAWQVDLLRKALDARPGLYG